MARLPTVESLGARPIPSSSGNIVPIRGDVGTGQVNSALAEAERVAFTMREKFADEDAEREALALETAYSDAIRQLSHGDGTEQNPGYMNLKGEAAVKARDGYIKSHESLYTDMIGRASSDRVMKKVQRRFAQRRSTALQSAAQHFGTERLVATKVTYDANLASIKDDAAVAGANGDSEAVQSYARLAGLRAAKYAEQAGLDPKTESEAAMTGILFDEIKRLNGIDSGLAREFFARNKQRMDGRVHADVNALLKTGEVKEWGQKHAERITKAGGTLQERLAKVDRMDASVERKDELRSRIEARWKVEKDGEEDAIERWSYSKLDALNSTGLGHTAKMAEAAKEKDPKKRKALEDKLVIRETRRIRDQEQADAETKQQVKLWAEENDFDAAMPKHLYDAAIKGGYYQQIRKWQAVMDSDAPLISSPEADKFFMRSDHHKIDELTLESEWFPHMNLDDRRRAAHLIRQANSAEARINRANAAALEKVPSYRDATAVARDVVAGMKKSGKKKAALQGELALHLRAFVDEYRAENKGRKPTATELHKHAAAYFLRGNINLWGWPDESIMRGRAVDRGVMEVEEGMSGSFYLSTADKDLAGISAATGIPQKYLPGLIKQLEEAYEPGRHVGGRYQRRQETPVTLDNLEDVFINNRDYAAISEAIGVPVNIIKEAWKILREAGQPVTLDNLARVKRAREE